MNLRAMSAAVSAPSCVICTAPIRNITFPSINSRSTTTVKSRNHLMGFRPFIMYFIGTFDAAEAAAVSMPITAIDTKLEQERETNEKISVKIIFDRGSSLCSKDLPFTYRPTVMSRSMFGGSFRFDAVLFKKRVKR